MADSGTPSDRWPPIEYYPGLLVSLVSLVIGAVYFVSAISLFSFCIQSVVGGAGVCLFPHWTATTFLAVGGILFSAIGIIYAGRAWLCLEPERYRRWQKFWHNEDPIDLC
jgi:hypothetical protein